MAQQQQIISEEAEVAQRIADNAKDALNRLFIIEFLFKCVCWNYLAFVHGSSSVRVLFIFVCCSLDPVASFGLFQCACRYLQAIDIPVVG